MPRKGQCAKRKRSEWGALTGLQSGQRLRLLAELAVPNVIGRLHSELVGCEGLESMGAIRFSEQRYPLMPHPTIPEWEKGVKRVLICYTDGNVEAPREGLLQQTSRAQGFRSQPGCGLTSSPTSKS